MVLPVGNNARPWRPLIRLSVPLLVEGQLRWVGAVGTGHRTPPWVQAQYSGVRGNGATPRDRFREYAAVFKGRHQLEWSKGLRERLGLGREATDEELVAREQEPAVWLGSLTLDEWRLVLWGEARGAVLAAAAAGGWSAVQGVVAELRLGQALDDRGG